MNVKDTIKSLFHKKKNESSLSSLLEGSLASGYQLVTEIVPAWGETPAVPPSNAEKRHEKDQERVQGVLTLKESMMAAACRYSPSYTLSKKTVADFLESRFGDFVIVNRRENTIKSGVLPLADTHYKIEGQTKSCFLYVFETPNRHVFFLARADEETAKIISEKHEAFSPSAFPKNRAKDWYVLFADDSFADEADVLAVLAFLFDSFSPERASAPAKTTDKPEERNMQTV